MRVRLDVDSADRLQVRPKMSNGGANTRANSGTAGTYRRFLPKGVRHAFGKIHQVVRLRFPIVQVGKV